VFTELATQVPTPGVDSAALASYFEVFKDLFLVFLIPLVVEL
jgi:hypothetical protein